MMFMSLKNAQAMGLPVGKDPRIAMTFLGRVVLVSHEPWADNLNRNMAELAATVDLGFDDQILLPPFDVEP